MGIPGHLRWEYQAGHVVWYAGQEAVLTCIPEICMQDKKQQLELDIEEHIGSK